MAEARILVVDDDPRIRDMLRRYLAGEGFLVSLAENGGEMRHQMAGSSPDLVLLDLVMPGEDGLALTRWIRSHSRVPIIMLTRKSDVVDRVVGLEVGADDYLPKPFDLRELLARIRAVLRRSEPKPTEAERLVETAAPRAGFRFNGWTLYSDNRELCGPGGDPVALTRAQFDLLMAFVTNAKRVLSRDRLIDLTKGSDWSAYDRSIDTQVLRLRRKIEPDPKRPVLIKSVRGVGYMLDADVQRFATPGEMA